MNSQLYNEIKDILYSELVPALGCTEPGAIAYAAYQAQKLLNLKPDERIEAMELWCSSNIVKNVKSVIVPNSGGMRGIEAAAILGASVRLSENSECELEILNYVTESERKIAKELEGTGFCVCHLQEDTPNLYIRVLAKMNSHVAEIIIQDGHTNIVYKALDEEVLLDRRNGRGSSEIDENKDKLSIKTILEFAEQLNLEDAEDIFKTQKEVNTAIGEEGIKNYYGSRVGQTLLNSMDKNDVRIRAVAKAAAGSDARMNGCIMPVVINSGSGNQGITVTVPVVEYAKNMNADDLTLYKALCISNLVSIHIKNHIGKLSAFCGAVSAACGSGAAIAYLENESYDVICHTISNTLANVGGIVCDGAKASCAAKIASSLDAAFLGFDMARRGCYFQSGEGFIEDDIEETIDNMGKIGKYGMKNTDKEIINLMLGHKDYICD